MIVVSLGTRATGVFEEFVGSWDIEAGRMAAEDMLGSAPPKIIRYSEDRPRLAAAGKSAHQNGSRCIRDRPGRSP